MNLLPQKEIKALKGESTLRLIVAICLLIVFLEVISIIILFPSYVIVSLEKDVLSSSEEQIKRSVSGKGSVESEIATIGDEIHTFLENESTNKSIVTDTIKNILTLRPSGITAHSLSIIRDGANGVVQISGVGASREVLIEYQRILAAQDFVKEAHYTEKFIMQKSNINYTLIISLK